MSVNFVGSSSASYFKTLSSLLRLGWLFDAVLAAGKRYDFICCSVFNFVAVNLTDLFFCFSANSRNAGISNCTSFGRVTLLRVPVV